MQSFATARCVVFLCFSFFWMPFAMTRTATGMVLRRPGGPTQLQDRTCHVMFMRSAMDIVYAPRFASFLSHRDWTVHWICHVLENRSYTCGVIRSYLRTSQRSCQGTCHVQWMGSPCGTEARNIRRVQAGHLTGNEDHKRQKRTSSESSGRPSLET